MGMEGDEEYERGHEERSDWVWGVEVGVGPSEGGVLHQRRDPSSFLSQSQSSSSFFFNIVPSRPLYPGREYSLVCDQGFSLRTCWHM